MLSESKNTEAHCIEKRVSEGGGGGAGRQGGQSGGEAIVITQVEIAGGLDQYPLSSQNLSC